MRLLLALALIAIPVQAAVPDLVCQEKFCMIRKETLVELLEETKKMSDHVTELRKLCGWKP